VSVWDAIVLGIVQGLTEFLPVSSSGHLVIAQTLLHVPTPGIFLEVALHVATLLSVVVVYRGRLSGIVVGALRRDRAAWHYIALIALATLPAVVVGLLLHDYVAAIFETPVVTGFMLVVTGGVLWSTRALRGQRGHQLPGWGLALGIGVAQAVAILPGISRSGATISTGMWGRLNGERAAEFSFLMSIPAILGAAVLELRGFSGAVAEVGGLALAAGFMAALVSGVLAILGLVWLVRRQIFYVFAFYVWGVAALFLLYLFGQG
jgi:undecaprenyl-diphosphatase